MHVQNNLIQNNQHKDIMIFFLLNLTLESFVTKEMHEVIGRNNFSNRDMIITDSLISFYLQQHNIYMTTTLWYADGFSDGCALVC